MEHDKQLKPVFGSNGAVVGYIDDDSRSGSIMAYDEDFNLVGAAGTITGARKLIVHTAHERSLARSQWLRTS